MSTPRTHFPKTKQEFSLLPAQSLEGHPTDPAAAAQKCGLGWSLHWASGRTVRTSLNTATRETGRSAPGAGEEKASIADQWS